MILYETIHEM
jgi:hypothetical protein